jgi:hypothetical protein
LWLAVRNGLTSPTPGDGYNVYASDGLNFWVYFRRKWQPISGVHVDTWSMAFSPAL